MDKYLSVINETAGELGLKVVKAIGKGKNVSEFKLADKADLDIHLARNALYKLHEFGLATFIRRKDQKKGWYICYWTLQPKKIKEEYQNLRQQKIDTLKERRTREETVQFYMCKNKCGRVDFDQAFSFEFKCPECGHIMNQEDNSNKLIEIEKEIKKIEEN